jgi:hypothetical protein
MFVGWLRINSLSHDLNALEKKVILDKNLIQKTVLENQYLGFGVYDGDALVALITAEAFDKSILINNFYYTEDVDTKIKQRVIKLLLSNLNESNKTILILSKEREFEIFQKFGFKSFEKFYKAVYSSGGVAFNFSSATAKSISNDNFMPVLKRVDLKAYGENRSEYIENNILKSSSLILSTAFGYQHSYAISKNIIKLSPWIMEDILLDDAEKLLRGVIYHRGLKKLVAMIPTSVPEITNLYKSYKFEFVETLHLMYKNEKPDVRLDMIYGF